MSRSFRHPQYADPRVPKVQGLQKASDLGGEKLKTPTKINGQLGITVNKAKTYKDLIDGIFDAMLSVSQQDIRNWFTHCCYCTS